MRLLYVWCWDPSFSQMPEEEAFLVFLKLMSDFGVREMFKSGFANLQLMFYQVGKK